MRRQQQTKTESSYEQEECSYGVIGYGSLILPTSALVRFDDELRRNVRNRISEADSRRLKAAQSYLLSSEAVSSYRKAEIELIPVRVNGFTRAYALETDPGNQLVATPGEGWINGAVISPLTKQQVHAISETEPGYKLVPVASENIELYDSKESEGTESLPDTIYINVPTADNQKVNWETEQQPDPVYQQLIDEGAALLDGETSMWNDDRFTEMFRRDFMETTLYRTDDEWQPMDGGDESIQAGAVPTGRSS